MKTKKLPSFYLEDKIDNLIEMETLLILMGYCHSDEHWNRKKIRNCNKDQRQILTAYGTLMQLNYYSTKPNYMLIKPENLIQLETYIIKH